MGIEKTAIKMMLFSQLKIELTRKTLTPDRKKKGKVKKNIDTFNEFSQSG